MHDIVHKTSCYSMCMNMHTDMGCGELDDSMMMYTERPSLNTTNHILKQLDDIDIVMHIGDISYAKGYSSVVCIAFTSYYSLVPTRRSAQFWGVQLIQYVHLLSVSLACRRSPGIVSILLPFSGMYVAMLTNFCSFSGMYSLMRLSQLLLESLTWSALGTMRETGLTPGI